MSYIKHTKGGTEQVRSILEQARASIRSLLRMAQYRRGGMQLQVVLDVFDGARGHVHLRDVGDGVRIDWGGD